MKLSADFSGQDPEAAAVKVLTEAPLGVQQVEITSCDVVDPDNGKDRRIEVTAKVVGGAYWPLRDYINVVSEKAVWKYDQFLMSVGVITPTKRKAAWDPAAQVGKKTYVLVRSESRQVTNPDGTTNTVTNSKIGGWLAKGQKTVEGVAASTAPEKEEGQDEDTTADEEISLEMHGAAADENEDQASIDFLTDKAVEAELDPNNYDTWAELAEVLGNLEEPEEEEEAAEEEETEEEEVDLEALGVAADEEDEEAQATLEEMAGEAELDPNDYPTWAELAEELGKADASEEEADAEAVDYGSKPLNWLKKECKEREMSDAGTKKELVERLEAFDLDPFAGEQQ